MKVYVYVDDNAEHSWVTQKSDRAANSFGTYLGAIEVEFDDARQFNDLKSIHLPHVGDKSTVFLYDGKYWDSQGTYKVISVLESIDVSDICKHILSDFLKEKIELTSLYVGGGDEPEIISFKDSSNCDMKSFVDNLSEEIMQLLISKNLIR